MEEIGLFSSVLEAVSTRSSGFICLACNEGPLGCVTNGRETDWEPVAFRSGVSVGSGFLL